MFFNQMEQWLRTRWQNIPHFIEQQQEQKKNKASYIHGFTQRTNHPKSNLKPSTV